MNPTTAPVLQDKWSVQKPYFPNVEEWIVGGDHLIGCSNRLLWVMSVYRGEESTGGAFPLRLQAAFGATNLTYADGVVYYTDGSSLEARSIPDGTPVAGWNGGTFDGVAALSVEAGVLTVVSTDASGQPQVAGVAPADGSRLWQTSAVGAGTPGPVALDDGAIFFATGGTLSAVNVGTGNVRFTQAASDVSAVLDQTNRPLCTGGAVVCGGTGVYAFDRRTGAVLWEVLEDGNTWVVAPGDDRFVFASGSNGFVAKIALADGATTPARATTAGPVPWIQPCPQPATPFTVGTDVFAVGSANGVLYAFDDATGTPTQTYTLADASPAATPLTGNGWIFLPTSDGFLHGLPFAPQDAAYFDGAAAHFEIKPLSGEFDFGLDDFTVELWVKSSSGGELLSSYPSVAGACGFRFNLGADGALQFAVVDAAETNADLWASDPAGCADGTWHHLAAVRRDGDVALYGDGVQRIAKRAYRRAGATVNPAYLEQAALCAPLAIGGGNTLIGGAARTSAQAPLTAPYTGLMREVRVWKRALTADRIADRRLMRLTFLTSDLLANWHLDHDWSEGGPADEALENDVQGYDFPGVFRNAFSTISDFVSNDGAYPFFLEKQALPWPYQSSVHWAVRGEDPIALAPVLGAGGTVCFGDDIALYGVEKLGGAKRWTLPMGEGCAPVVADGTTFLTLSRQFGPIAIDAATGTFGLLDGFSSVIVEPADHGVPLAGPAVSPAWLAVAAPDGNLWIRRRSAAAASAVPAGAAPERVQIAGDLIAAYASGTITVVDAATLTVSARLAADSAAFSFDAQRLVCVQGGELTAYDPGNGFAPAGRCAAGIAGTITGLAAATDANLLVATSDGGGIAGFSMGNLTPRWTYAHPSGTALGSVFAPALVDGDAAVTCTSGAVLVIDGFSGETIAEVGAAGAAVPATAPIADSGTLYYGCASEGTDGLKDGALHAVAIGRTFALRLGEAASAPHGYGDITSATPFPASVPGEACVEAWINTQDGGEIFSLLPSAAGPTTYARFAIDAAGALAVDLAARPEATAPWASATYRTAATGAADGRWHHVAFSANGVGDIRVYVDGARQSGTYGTPASVPAAAAGGRAFIGAGAPGADGAPTAFYTGLLAEVRLWDVYLVAAELHARGQTKLRGDEPDLTAYWNFDARSLHDSARNGYDGTLAGAGRDADYWLTHLMFRRPAYPYLTTAAKITATSDAGTTYELTVATFKADASALPATLQLWYVAPPGTQPATIAVRSGSGSAATLTGVAPEHEGDPSTSYAFATDATGGAVVTVTTTDPNHGPSLDLRADYMYPQERYHVSVLIDNQTLSRPGQPALTAQTKLMEDYAYVPGDGVKAANRQHTFRVVLAARSSDGSPMPGEPVAVWADKPVTFTSVGKPYAIGPSDPASLTTDVHGEATLVIQADGIACPELSAWTSFMERDARIKVAPDHDVRGGLASVQGGDLTLAKPLGRNDDGTTEHSAVLTDDYVPHSSDISQTMRHLMAGAQSHDAPAAVTALHALRAKRPLRAAGPLRATAFADMAQLPPWTTADLVPDVPTLLHTGRRTPVTPEFVRASIHAIDPTAIGFAFSCTGRHVKTFSFTLLHSDDEMRSVMTSFAAGKPGVLRAEMLGFSLGGLWDDIKDAAESAWDDAQALVVKIGDDVEAAIQTAAGWLTVAIHDIGAAFAAIGNFLEQLAIELVKIIKMLLSFFDFAEILAIAGQLESYMTQVVNDAADYVDAQQYGAKVQQGIDWLKHLGSAVGGHSVGLDSIAAVRQKASNAVASAGDSVKGKYSRDKLAEHGAQAVLQTMPAPGGQAADIVASLVEGIGAAFIDFMLAIPDVARMSVNDLLALLEKLAVDVLEPAVDELGGVLEALADGLGDTVRSALTAIAGGVDIPFLGDLYYWLTGHHLRLVDLATFALAIPINIVYEVAYQEKFTASAPQQLPRLLAPMMLAGPRRLGDPDDSSVNQLYVVTTVLIGPFQALVDLAKMARLKGLSVNGGSGTAAEPFEQLLQITLGVLSVANIAVNPTLDLSSFALHEAFQGASLVWLLVNKDEKASISNLDIVGSLVATGVGITAIVQSLANKDLSDARKAELILWNLPNLYRPGIIMGRDNPDVAAVIFALDVACYLAAGMIEAIA